VDSDALLTNHDIGKVISFEKVQVYLQNGSVNFRYHRMHIYILIHCSHT